MCNIPGLSEENAEILRLLLQHIEAIDRLQFGFLFDRELVTEIRDEFKKRQVPRLARAKGPREPKPNAAVSPFQPPANTSD